MENLAQLFGIDPKMFEQLNKFMVQAVEAINEMNMNISYMKEDILSIKQNVDKFMTHMEK